MNRRQTVTWLLLVTAFLAVATLAHAGAGLVVNNDEPVLIKVTPSDPVEQTQFGMHVAVSDETMVATRYQGPGTGEYAAYVFVRSAEGWSEQQKIALPDDPRAAAVHADTLAVSIHGEVQVWVREAGVWRNQAHLTDIGGDYVGSLAIEQNTLVAGRYVFVRTGDTWALQQKLTSSHGHAHDDFGAAVSIKDNAIVISAAAENAPIQGAGAVYVFERELDVWSEKARLVRSGAVRFDTLGSSIAFDGGQIAACVGGWASQTGAICVWERAGSSWKLRQQITSPDGRPGNLVDYGGDAFGTGLGLAGDVLVAGAPEDDDRGSNSGSIYILRRVNGAWVHQRKITAPDGGTGDYLGLPLAVDAGRVVAGMRFDDSPLDDAGSVYAFDLGFVTPAETTLTVETPYVLVNDALPNLNLLTTYASADPAHGTLEMSADGSFAYTPSANWKGTDRFAYACTDGVSSSNSASVTVQTWMPTSLTLSASDTTPLYGRYSTLRATLKSLDGAPVAGQSVAFEALSGTTWVPLGAVKTGSTGIASKTVYSLVNAKIYRARTGWSTLYGAAGSNRLTIRPHAYLTAPVAPAVARTNRYFTAYGYLKPHHTPGTAPIRLYFYRYESGSWVYKKSVAATVKDYSTFSKYSKSVSLPRAGSWRVRAYHAADLANAATWSGIRSFRVR